MSEGFVVSDKVRNVVFSAVVGGERDLDRIAKRHHVVGRAAERAANELAEEGLLAKGETGWTLTDKGRETARGLGKKDASFL